MPPGPWTLGHGLGPWRHFWMYLCIFMYICVFICIFMCYNLICNFILLYVTLLNHPWGDHRRPQFVPRRFVAAFRAPGRGRVVRRTGRRVTLAWFWAGSGRVFAFLADLGSLLGSATSRNLRYSASGCQGKSQQP